MMKVLNVVMIVHGEEFFEYDREIPMKNLILMFELKDEMELMLKGIKNEDEEK